MQLAQQSFPGLRCATCASLLMLVPCGKLAAQSSSIVPESSASALQTSEGLCLSESPIWLLAETLVLQLTDASDAEDASKPQRGPTQCSDTGNRPDSIVNGPNDWLHKWMHNVDKARATQPHYVAPLITTHVDLVQQFRWDSSWQTNANGFETANYGNAHGLEIIPTAFLEVQVAPPPYIVHTGPTPNGSGDLSLFFKYRIASATEGKGDYFVGAFLGASMPTGSLPNGVGHGVLTPMLAFAKGWPGYVSVQNNFAGNLPTSGTNILGRQFIWNTTLQAYGIKKYVWPEVEQNSTWFYGGPLSGKETTFITPGVILGYFQIAGRLHVGVGGGMQIAVTRFHTYNHRWIWSMRFPF